MLDIPAVQVLEQLALENPWWKEPHTIQERYSRLQRREYFALFYRRLSSRLPHRALVLMGPRRVGKTVIVHHAVAELINTGTPPNRIFYVSVDHPLYNGCSLEQLLGFYGKANQVDWREEQCFVFFDEIQYLRNWEQHLKRLVDDYDNIKLVASGSAAAALKLKSHESGAGRFSDFLLPPLTFHEYVSLLQQSSLVAERAGDEKWCAARNIAALNEAFVDYLNFGGYPEVALSKIVQSDPAQFLKSDIIDKVLLRDLPSLYGIQDTQELNHLFTTLAFNTSNEVSLEGLAQKSGVAKNTIKRYIEYLEAAFLLKTVNRLDRSARRFQRQNHFKVYLTNPSMRSALFSPVGENDQAIGALAETAAFAQWFHSPAVLHYARWPAGEVDIVSLRDGTRPAWVTEVKWSDRHHQDLGELSPLIEFARDHTIEAVIVTTKTYRGVEESDGVTIQFVPVSEYCYTVGRNIVNSKNVFEHVESRLEANASSTDGAENTETHRQP